VRAWTRRECQAVPGRRLGLVEATLDLERDEGQRIEEHVPILGS